MMESVPHILLYPALEKHGPTPGMPLSSLIALLLTGKVVCEEPNSRMHYFTGHLEWEGKKYSLDSGNILLRGCKIRNTETCYGMVIYAGMTTLGPLQHELPWWGWVRTLKLLSRNHKARACLLSVCCHKMWGSWHSFYGALGSKTVEISILSHPPWMGG